MSESLMMLHAIIIALAMFFSMGMALAISKLRRFWMKRSISRSFDAWDVPEHHHVSPFSKWH